MTDFFVEEKEEYHEAEMSFENGEVSFAAGVQFSGYSHTFSQDNTKKLYQAMREYYETKT